MYRAVSMGTQWILLSVTCKYIPLRFSFGCLCVHVCVCMSVCMWRGSEWIAFLVQSLVAFLSSGRSSQVLDCLSLSVCVYYFVCLSLHQNCVGNVGRERTGWAKGKGGGGKVGSKRRAKPKQAQLTLSIHWTFDILIYLMIIQKPRYQLSPITRRISDTCSKIMHVLI